MIYNTIEEYEDRLDLHSLHNNGVRRCLNTLQKLRSTFRDFQVETLCLTHDQLNLENILCEYYAAWNFYKKNLSRRRNAESLVIELLNYYYNLPSVSNITSTKESLFKSIIDDDINLPILILLMLKVLPGFDSKDGNVINITASFHKVTSLLEEFTSGNTCFSVLPAILQAKEEEYKSRITLIYHTSRIINMYSSYKDSDSIYELSAQMKQNIIDLDLEGYWNQCAGQLNSTIFCHIEHALNDGSYFVTTWHKDSENLLTGIKYTMNLSLALNDKLMAYVLHPQAIKQRIKGLPYTDEDNVWYETNIPSTDSPKALRFTRMMNSNYWPKTLNLTRVSDPKVIARYEKWLSNYVKEIPYEDMEYNFIPNLYASTPDNLYIPKDDGTFYKIPRTACEGLDNIQLGDLAGIMTIGDKQYIVFDDILLYIEINEEQLDKYGIKIVDSIK